MEYKHYIRLDGNNKIIAAFSDAFQSPQDGDILYRESDERHFNPELFDEMGIPKLEWKGKKIIEHKYDDDDKAAVTLAQSKAALAASDQGVIRGIDDLVNLLVEKKIISREELPDEFTEKIKAREKLRVKS